MARLEASYRLIRVLEDNVPGALHIPNAPDLGGGAAQTLCGWCDVPAEDVLEGLPTCEDCLSIVRYCKGLRTRG